MEEGLVELRTDQGNDGGGARRLFAVAFHVLLVTITCSYTSGLAVKYR